MGTWTLPAELAALIATWSSCLDGRIAPRLLTLFSGVFFARGRRTVASWLRAAAVGDDFRLYYYLVGTIGRKVDLLARVLLLLLLRRLAPDDHWLFVLDDTPTKRYGPCVEGAGRHHNPTPGPSAQKFLFGHVWVTLSWILTHPWWGPIGLPLLARLYVRQCDFRKIAPWDRWDFKTKLVLAADLLAWLAESLGATAKAIWLAADGFYAKKQVFQAARRHGMVLFTRLRRDARLRSVPPVIPAGQRGRGQPRKYGKERLSLAKRAGHAQGWQTCTVTQYRKQVTKTYKTFLATWEPAGGLIRVVLVRETTGWLAFCCTDTSVSAATVLEVMAQRGVIEEDFHDIKEVQGAGKQQVRNIWANIGAYHVCLWAYTLIEWWGWDRRHSELCDRSASPWDQQGRRPSHADRRKALQLQGLEEGLNQEQERQLLPRRIRRWLDRLVRWAV